MTDISTAAVERLDKTLVSEADLNAGLADIIGPWWSEAAAKFIRAGKLSQADINAKYVLRDLLAKHISADRDRLTAELAQIRAEVEALVNAAQMLADETVDYAAVNNLGDGEKNHAVKQVRKALAAIQERLK